MIFHFEHGNKTGGGETRITRTTSVITLVYRTRRNAVTGAIVSTVMSRVLLSRVLFLALFVCTALAQDEDDARGEQQIAEELAFGAEGTCHHRACRFLGVACQRPPLLNSICLSLVAQSSS